MFYGSVAAIYQTNIKRLFAYSSIAQIGYIILGLALSNVTGLTASVLHLFNHALMKSALFMALGCIVYRTGSVSITSIRGLGKEMPWTIAAVVLAGLSLIGVPTSVGFVSKWYLILGAIENGWWPIVFLIVASSLLAVIYVWKVVESAYFTASTLDRPTIKEVPIELLIPLWVLVACNFYFGINADLTISIASKVANIFLGSGL